MGIVTEHDPWTMRIQEVVGNRVGNCFFRMGLDTLAKVRDTIEYRQLYAMGKQYMFGGEDAPYTTGLGPKSWQAVLDTLETLGFDWEAHVVRYKAQRPYTTPTKEQQRAEIKEAILELTDMLRSYLEATEEEGVI